MLQVRALPGQPASTLPPGFGNMRSMKLQTHKKLVSADAAMRGGAA